MLFHKTDVAGEDKGTFSIHNISVYLSGMIFIRRRGDNLYSSNFCSDGEVMRKWVLTISSTSMLLIVSWLIVVGVTSRTYFLTGINVESSKFSDRLCPSRFIFVEVISAHFKIIFLNFGGPKSSLFCIFYWNISTF